MAPSPIGPSGNGTKPLLTIDTVSEAGQIRSVRASDGILLLLPSLAILTLHAVTNGQYGFHRDELAVLDDARHLAWGYVAYPPITPLIARLALDLSGPSLAVLRFFSSLSMAIATVLASLIAYELGGSGRARVVAAVAVAIAPISLLQGAIFQYVSFDYLWWVLGFYGVIRLLKSDNPRWWLFVGAIVGVGLETKYTMAFWVAALAVAVLGTRARRHLTSPWLWGGAVVAILIVLPNLVWQIQHGFISLEFLSSIHARDVRIGRTSGFVPEQFVVSSSLFTVPLWIGGLVYLLISAPGKRFRALGWIYVVLFVVFLVAQSRSYYLAPAYPVLLAAGSVAWERWLAVLPKTWSRLVHGIIWGGLAIGGLLGAALVLPIAPVNSDLWRATSAVHDTFVEEIGWPDLVDAVASVYASLPPEERAGAAILAGNYGEAGAIDLYGPAHGLPMAISGADSYWARGYGDPPPRTLLVLGFSEEEAADYFTSCSVAGHVSNRYAVANEETTYHSSILVCRGTRQPWPVLWPRLRSFN
jgi:4-amino-4-deoxy-L-arabinose transferase-like glycosyltransferase